MEPTPLPAIQVAKGPASPKPVGQPPTPVAPQGAEAKPTPPADQIANKVKGAEAPPSGMGAFEAFPAGAPDAATTAEATDQAAKHQAILERMKALDDEANGEDTPKTIRQRIQKALETIEKFNHI